MNKFLLTAALLSLSVPCIQAKEKKAVEESAPRSNLYQPIPRIQADPNGASNWRVTVMKPTQHYYTKNGIISYRYIQATEHPENIFGDYLGPRAAVFKPQVESLTTEGSTRSYASVNNRNLPGVTMAPRTEIPVEKAKKSAKSAETSIELAQQR